MCAPHSRNFLRLNWLTESWNVNEAMPGGMLAFELLSQPATRADEAPGKQSTTTTAYFLKLFFVSQSMSQMRHATPLSPAAAAPSKVFVTIPECATGPEASCPLPVFRAIVLRALRPECVHTVSVASL